MPVYNLICKRLYQGEVLKNFQFSKSILFSGISFLKTRLFGDIIAAR